MLQNAFPRMYMAFFLKMCEGILLGRELLFGVYVYARSANYQIVQNDDIHLKYIYLFQITTIMTIMRLSLGFPAYIGSAYIHIS